MGFRIAPLPLRQLLLEALALLLRIVQLTEGIAQLEAPDIKLEPLHPVRLVRLVLGKRRDRDGKVVDDGWLNQVVLGNRFEDAGDGLSRRLARLVIERDSRPSRTRCTICSTA